MKKYSKYSLPILLLLMATGLVSVSCADEDLSNNANERNGVSFVVSDVQDAPDADLPTLTKSKEAYLTRSINFNEAGTADMCLQESTVPGVNPVKRTPQTRAWLKNTIDANFGAFACQNGSAGPDYFDNEQVNPSGQMLQPKSWGSTASTLKFYAVYPYMDGTNAQQKLVYPTTGSLPYVAFEASTDIANQTDLMTAETAPINYTATGGSPHVVPLKFYHALTAIRFGIGSNLSWNKTIKSIEFQGIYKAGHFDLATKTWSHQNGTQNFKLDNVNKSTSGTLNTVIVKDGNTFLMVPQTLPAGAKIVITFTDNSHITANIGGKTWAPGTTKTYMMTEKNSNWEYKIETTDPNIIAYDQTTSTTPYTIKSYRKDPATNTFQAVKWKVVSYQESTDGGLTWGAETQTKPTWLTNLSTESGDGGTAAESGAVTVTKEIFDHMEAYNNVLKTAPEKGSAATPYNLANQADGGATIQNTANSYLISAPGYYRIPLVYGNAIHTTAASPNVGIDNPSSYKTSKTGARVLTNFKDHNDQNITSPYINIQNGAAPATQASIVWADQSGIVDNLSVTNNGNQSFVNFHVPADKIRNGNAVIAIKNASGTIMWSWHLWFDHADALDIIPCTNYQGKIYKFTKNTLGFVYTKFEETAYNKPRVVKVKVQQMKKNGENYNESVITITQTPGNIREVHTTLYQWGRRDALAGTDAIKEGSYSFDPANGGRSLGYATQHPEKMFNLCKVGSMSYGYYNWCVSIYDNLWSADNTVWGTVDNLVVKTVYDPCPVGFHTPASNAFTGFSKTGVLTTKPEELNIAGSWSFGYDFHNKLTFPDATIYFPASGNRNPAYNGVRTAVNFCAYSWTAVPYDANNGYTFAGTSSVNPAYIYWRSLACPVRPVAE